MYLVYSFYIWEIADSETERLIEQNWWKGNFSEEDFKSIDCSGKFMLLFSILADCEARRDKLLVFSQSRYSLSAIEKFLKMIDENTLHIDPMNNSGAFSGTWKTGVDYFRLDGDTDLKTRFEYCERFNDIFNFQAR